jgi:hypothetical protein
LNIGNLVFLGIGILNCSSILGVYDEYAVFTKINPVHIFVVTEVYVSQKLNPEQLSVRQNCK